MAMPKLQRKKMILALLTALFIVVPVTASFAASQTEDTALHLLPGTAFMLPLGSTVKVRWVIPPASKVKPKAHFSIGSGGSPLIGYGESEKRLMFPEKEYLLAVDRGFSDFTFLDNGALLLANCHDIGILAKPEQKLQKREGIPIAGFQPVTSVPVRNCDVFGSFNNTAYCAGLNEKSGEQELYMLRSEKIAGPRELDKILVSPEPVTAVAGDGEALFVAIGRRVYKIDPDNKRLTPYYLHPSARINQLAYSAESGLFISTGKELIFAGTNGTMEIMRAPSHQIEMRHGILYVFFSRSFALFAVENLNDLKRFNLAVQPVAAAQKKSPLTITSTRFFESATPPSADKIYADSFDRTAVRSIVGRIDYKAASPLKRRMQHTVTVSWYEPTGGLLMSCAYNVVLQPRTVSGSVYAAIGGEKGRGGYARQGWKFGPDALGLRYPGKYRMTVQVDGIPVSESFFTINGTATPLEALEYDDQDTMQRLLAQGLNPNQKNEYGVPLLHQAVQYGTPRLVELLLKSGADPNAVDGTKAPALDMALRRSGWREKADLLIRYGARVNTTITDTGLPLVHNMALTEPQLYYLLQKGVSVQTVHPATKNSLLTKVAYRDYNCTDRVFSLLMKGGANLDTFDDMGRTPLGNAIDSPHPECVDQLLKRGASTAEVYKEKRVSRSALYLAVRGYLDDEKENDSSSMVTRSRIIRLLMAKGEVFGPRDDGLLERAAKSENPEIIQLVIRRYVEKAREDATSAGDWDGLRKALADCNTARRLSETGAGSMHKDAVPEIYLYCGLIENRFSDSKQMAAADLQKYLTLVPEAGNAADIRALLDQLKK